jgi:hypothetical protein
MAGAIIGAPEGLCPGPLTRRDCAVHGCVTLDALAG